ncbi:hypothetical protein CYMTET_12137 [Cymbomonas tetramitiformis]|uniref:TFIIS N-terminal domain-containing protein n=1 Tax=Cymbomonas tetramitiformis TaxID=36881 RepID=A0AAE0GKP3_9CHLO|nr:hypothetical protein CYMTET_12137 [Cymbomonas tetramitiformis]
MRPVQNDQVQLQTTYIGFWNKRVSDDRSKKELVYAVESSGKRTLAVLGLQQGDKREYIRAPSFKVPQRQPDLPRPCRNKGQLRQWLADLGAQKEFLEDPQVEERAEDGNISRPGDPRQLLVVGRSSGSGIQSRERTQQAASMHVAGDGDINPTEQTCDAHAKDGRKGSPLCGYRSELETFLDGRKRIKVFLRDEAGGWGDKAAAVVEERRGVRRSMAYRFCHAAAHGAGSPEENILLAKATSTLEVLAAQPPVATAPLSTAGPQIADKVFSVLDPVDAMPLLERCGAACVGIAPYEDHDSNSDDSDKDGVEAMAKEFVLYDLNELKEHAVYPLLSGSPRAFIRESALSPAQACSPPDGGIPSTVEASPHAGPLQSTSPAGFSDRNAAVPSPDMRRGQTPLEMIHKVAPEQGRARLTARPGHYLLARHNSARTKPASSAELMPPPAKRSSSEAGLVRRGPGRPPKKKKKFLAYIPTSIPQLGRPLQEWTNCKPEASQLGRFQEWGKQLQRAICEDGELLFGGRLRNTHMPPVKWIHPNKVLEILRQLEGAEVTLELLESSKIAEPVAMLRGNRRFPEIMERASHIVSKWRAMLEAVIGTLTNYE